MRGSASRGKNASARMLPWISSNGSPEPCTSYSRSTPLRLTRCIGSLLFLSRQSPTQTSTFLRDIIAVGRPVTRPPPHRSRRAVFSHRALQKYSLPHVGLSHQDCLLWPWPPNHPWAFDLEVLECFWLFAFGAMPCREVGMVVRPFMFGHCFLCKLRMPVRPFPV